METNTKAPDFTLPDENGNPVSLDQFRGKNVVCSSILKPIPRLNHRSVRVPRRIQQAEKAGLVVLGISPDTPKAQLKFKEKHDLPYTLLADDKKEVAKKFDVLKEKNMYGKKVMGIVRTTFLISPEGKIAHVFQP